MRHTKTLVDIVGLKVAKCLPTSLPDLLRLSMDDLLQRGINLTDARRIRGAISFAQEINEPQANYSLRISSPATAIQYCLEQFRAIANHGVQEEFWLITLNTKNQPINSHLITKGTLRNSLVHPREVFRPAIADAANCILLWHNHPSGDPTPSDQDVAVTERLEKAAEIIGIPVIDHVVVAGDKAISIQEWRSGNRW